MVSIGFSVSKQHDRHHIDIYCHRRNLLFLTHLDRKNGGHHADDILTFIFLHKNCCNLIQISIKFVPIDPIHIKPALVQTMPLRDFTGSCIKTFARLVNSDPDSQALRTFLSLTVIWTFLLGNLKQSRFFFSKSCFNHPGTYQYLKKI